MNDKITVTYEDNGTAKGFYALDQDWSNESLVTSYDINCVAVITKYDPQANLTAVTSLPLTITEGGSAAFELTGTTKHLYRADPSNGDIADNTLSITISDQEKDGVAGDYFEWDNYTPSTSSNAPTFSETIKAKLKDAHSGTGGAGVYTCKINLSASGGVGWKGDSIVDGDNSTYTATPVDVSVTVEAVQAGGGGAFSTSAASVPFTSSPDFDDFPDTVPATEEYFSETDAIACYEINSEETWTGWAAFRQLSIDWEFDDPGTNKWDIYNEFNVNNDDPSMWSLDDTITAVPDLTLDKYGSNDVTDSLMYNMTQSHQFYTTKGGTQGSVLNPPAGVAWGNGLAYVMDINGDNLVGFEFFNGKSTSDTMADATGGSTAADLNNAIFATIGLNYYVSETSESGEGSVANSIYTTSLAAYNSTIGTNFTTPASYTRSVVTAAAASAGTHTFIKKSETI
ncbi:hypothetical protein CMK18_20560 [Candidatus Poribacteria bacterium]|nr:hypothetical protein [Candidatus Poribacteria bacterium]